jgi:hypothetical protein
VSAVFSILDWGEHAFQPTAQESQEEFSAACENGFTGQFETPEKLWTS